MQYPYLTLHDSTLEWHVLDKLRTELRNGARDKVPLADTLKHILNTYWWSSDVAYDVDLAEWWDNSVIPVSRGYKD